MKKILILDDHPVVIRGLKSIIDDSGRFVVTGEALDADEGMIVLAGTNPDIVIADVELGQTLDGLEFVRRARKSSPNIRILVMSMDDGSSYAARAIRAGAAGYISKADIADNILVALETVAAGKVYLDDEVCDIVAEVHFREFAGPGSTGVAPLLTDGELEVFQLIGRGYNRREIAEKINLSINTIEAYRRKLRMKLGIHSASELTRAAIKHEASRFNIMPVDRDRQA